MRDYIANHSGALSEEYKHFESMLIFDFHTIGNKMLSERKRIGLTQAEVVCFLLLSCYIVSISLLHMD